MKRRGFLAKVGALALLVLAGLWVHAQLESHPEKASISTHTPAEFLYLDGRRVLAYLAQFEGGRFTTEQLTSKVANTKNGKVAVDAVEIGEKSQEERSVARQITATAAGNYVELLTKLESHGLKTIGLGHFRHDVEGLEEGQLVMFQTHSLSSPVYLNPYLAVRQPKTLSTLFPMSAGGGPHQARVESLREEAEHFRGQVGKDPRAVFAIRPVTERDREELRARRSGGTQAPRGVVLSPAEVRVGKKNDEENHVEYLMPVDAHLISQERSLIKYGGGEFTVVGKVVRIFPEPGDGHSPAYIDSPTLETWEQPLDEAPLQLLCRTDPKCTAKVREDGATEKQVKAAMQDSRKWAIEALERQTEIPRRGAVIVPIAIYK